MNNIILIGMPACGKSVTGVVLAKILNKNFIDADLLIQEYAGKSLQRIIDEDGIDEFKRIEEEVLSGIEVDNTVIATGGSAVYYRQAMEHLKAGGKVVYLEASIGTIKERLRNIKTRGVAMGKGQSLEELYDMRLPLYKKYADVTVHTGRSSIEDTLADIVEALGKKDSD